jgi:hypothetical protein
MITCPRNSITVTAKDSGAGSRREIRDCSMLQTFSEERRTILKIISINGSRRKKGNTGLLIESILKPLEQSGAEVKSIFLGDYSIGACTGCEGCKSSWECVIKDDFQFKI